jgi:hypothetical protein
MREDEFSDAILCARTVDAQAKTSVLVINLQRMRYIGFSSGHCSQDGCGEAPRGPWHPAEKFALPFKEQS